MRLKPAEFEAEKRYQGLMYFVKRMVSEGLVTDAEYHKIAAEYAEKLNPKTGTLLTAIPLQCVPHRVMNESGKEGLSP